MNRVRKVLFAAVAVFGGISSGMAFSADCSMESQDCRLRPEHLGLVNGHVTFCTQGDCLARVTRVFAPPYFTRDFELDVRFNGENADLASPTYTWTPACVERRGVAADSWNVTTRAFAIAGERGGILEVTAQNVHRDARDLSVEVSQKGEAGYCRVWRFDPPTESEAGHPAALVQGTTLPDGKNSAVFRAVPNRGVVRFFVAFALGAPERAKQVVTAALAEPERTVADAVADWDRRWNALKAKVPRFECDDKGLERLYERSLLHFALCEWNVDEFIVKPFYATGGLFGSCVCSYLWNLGGPYRMWPLIAPEAIKAHIAQYLKLDLTNCYAFSPVDGAPVGPYYQINQEKMLFLIHSYVMETGDVGYLSETVAGKRIIDHVVDFALLFDDLSKDAVLVDYGSGGHSHLELRLGFRYDGVMPDMNLRRIALYYLADELCRAAGHRPKVDLVARAKALKALCREKLWDPQQGWFSGVCTDGVRTTRWTMQMFKALGWRGKVLDPDQEEALVGHLMDETEFLGPHGVHSLSKKDVAYHAQDVDNGGPGACPSFAPAIVNRLYRDGRTDEGDAILMRLKWLADSFPYWADSQFADRKDYRHNTPLQLNVEGGCLAQTIVFGLFGVDVGTAQTPTFKPHLPSGVKHLSLKGLRLCGKRYDVSVDNDKTVVTVDGDLAVSRQRLFPGFDGKTCKIQPSVATDGNGLAILGFQKLLLSGGDVFYGQYLSRSTDGGRTWSEPMLMTALDDERRDGLRVARYATVFYSRKNRRWFGLGQCCTYKNDSVPNNEYRDGRPYSWPIYVTLDPARGEYTSCKAIDFPLPYAGCLPFGQQVECDNGDLLVPFYYDVPEKATQKREAFQVHNRVVVARCRFEGESLVILKTGTPIACDGLRRGVGEPSLMQFGKKVYITLRSDEMGMWAESDDGLNFSRPKPWTWTTGERIGNANTQQHWMMAGEMPYLAYTRVTPTNGHVFRNRAPIFLARFDPRQGGLVRETEFPLVPERGARLGNFCCTPSHDGGSWLVTAEWMQPAGCERYGSDNSLWLCKVRPSAGYAHGALCLTFDDRNFGDWERALPCFERHGAHVTFFVCSAIDETALATMRTLQSAGHSVGLHGQAHEKATELLRKFGEARYLETEVLPQVRAVAKAGLSVGNWAYPMSSRDETTDRVLGRHFTRMRTGCLWRKTLDGDPLCAHDQVFVPMSEVSTRTVIFGTPVPSTLAGWQADVRGALLRASERNEMLCLYAHGIQADGPSDAHDISIVQLETILATANELGVAVIGFDEL